MRRTGVGPRVRALLLEVEIASCCISTGLMAIPDGLVLQGLDWSLKLERPAQFEQTFLLLRV